MKTPFACLSARLILPISSLLMILAPSAASQNQPAKVAGTNQASGRAATTIATPSLCAACIRAHMEFLASDAMRGRGSGTADELLAATYVGSQLRAYGIAPAGRQRQLHSASRTPTAKVVRPAPDYVCEERIWRHRGNNHVDLRTGVYCAPALTNSLFG